MRFLLHAAAAAATPKRAAATAVADAATTTSATTTTNTTTRTTKLKLWGQQCGVSCGCVLRIELGVNDDNRVVTAEYTAKRILTTSTTTAATDNRRPVLTSKGRLQYTPSPCVALHQLSANNVRFFLQGGGRQLWQLQNYHDFSQARSSAAFRRAVLQAQRLGPQHSHCFDLVEDVVTALLKGYIPAARNEAKEYCHFLSREELSDNDDEEEELSAESISWQEQTKFAPSWWPWNKEKVAAEIMNESSSHRVFPSSPLLTSTTDHWTALDWMDWAEHERQQLDHRHQLLQSRLLTDWLSYVDWHNAEQPA